MFSNFEKKLAIHFIVWDLLKTVVRPCLSNALDYGGDFSLMKNRTI